VVVATHVVVLRKRNSSYPLCRGLGFDSCFRHFPIVYPTLKYVQPTCTSSPSFAQVTVIQVQPVLILRMSFSFVWNRKQAKPWLPAGPTNSKIPFPARRLKQTTLTCRPQCPHFMVYAAKITSVLILTSSLPSRQLPYR